MGERPSKKKRGSRSKRRNVSTEDFREPGKDDSPEQTVTVSWAIASRNRIWQEHTAKKKS